jgi:hypothetical protein
MRGDSRYPDRRRIEPQPPIEPGTGGHEACEEGHKKGCIRRNEKNLLSAMPFVVKFLKKLKPVQDNLQKSCLAERIN